MSNNIVRHIPVLAEEIYQQLVTDHIKKENDDNENYYHLDCNFGDGGHVEYFIENLLALKKYKKAFIYALDLDQEAIVRGKTFLEKYKNDDRVSINIIQGNFADIIELTKGIKFDSILFDLGLSTYQLSESGRGFSFKFDEKLDMRFSTLEPTEGELTAYDIINSWSLENILLILRKYADETSAWRIANKIVEIREKKPIETSKELADLIQDKVFIGRKGKIHPATKTFQAIRIAVNSELQVLSKGLLEAYDSLKENGQIAVISYHSLEDVIVKQFFKQLEKDSKGKCVNKKVIIPNEEEIKKNTKSRSAKLRIFKK
jgi:16S rRNA (cytosine1402-N4)-methyltransferase